MQQDIFVEQHHLACWLKLGHVRLFSFQILSSYFVCFRLCSFVTFLLSIHVFLLCFLLLWVLYAAPQEQVGHSVFSL